MVLVHRYNIAHKFSYRIRRTIRPVVLPKMASFSWFFVLILFTTMLLLDIAETVDRNNFKTCDQSAFCKRHRNTENRSQYEVIKTSITRNESAIVAELRSEINKLRLVIVTLDDSTIRLLIDEIDPIRSRYQPLDALKEAGKLKMTKFSDVKIEDEKAIASLDNDAMLLLNYKPFRIDIVVAEEIVMSINSGGLLKYEHYRIKAESNSSADGEGFWEETFKSTTDSKPYGSSSVGVDFSFIGYKYIYGIPEHADTFALRSTTGADPYRLYNLDVFEFEVHNQMSLYGSVPFLMAHNAERTLALLWLNAAETWVDVRSSTADKGMLRALVDRFKSSAEVPQIDAHFISESGLIDVFVMLGPKPVDVFRQNAALTGTHPLPPLFALGYHQCRWNYNDQEDVDNIHENFDKYDIPLDTIWLDIEHTDQKKYFTWDSQKFPKPKEMIDSLSRKGRKMVVIVDPHIKRDDSYHVYKDARALGYFIKDKDGSTDYEGHCWPGASMYLDFLNPLVRTYWANKFSFDQYVGSTEDLFIWNDMNEPSVFSGPEITMHKDAKHYGGWEHRDVHNIYSLYHHSSTYNGLLSRSEKKLRPFVLTRSFFIGSQRTTAVWTGDNTASWEQLRITIPMLLSLSVSGIPFVGSDVGGFFGNPDEQLLIRWYQAAAFQPFFRAHAHIDTRRREPWLFSSETTRIIRDAIRRRYSFLPYWYTLFYEHSKFGKPVLLPLWAEFPDDESSFDEEREHLIGSALLVRPIIEPDVSSVSLYLPGRRNVIWYDWSSHKPTLAPGAVYVDATMDTIPLFQRSETIIPIRERIRRSSALMRQDPITLYVATAIKNDFANGTLYLDDGESYEYVNDEFIYVAFVYKKESDHLYSITCKRIGKQGELANSAYIEKIIIRGVRYYPRIAHVFLDDWNPISLDLVHNRDQQTLVLDRVNAPVSVEFRIDIHA